MTSQKEHGIVGTDTVYSFINSDFVSCTQLVQTHEASYREDVLMRKNCILV
jgi:hypothetical protein